MRVGELIEELKKFSPDLPVIFTDTYAREDGDFAFFENDIAYVNLSAGCECTVVELEGGPYREVAS